MVYNGKNIWEERPDAADDYRQRYADGIEEYITRMNEESKTIRREYMPPESFVRDAEKYRAEYVKMLGLDRLDRSEVRPVEKVFVGSDDVCDIYRLTVYITKEIPFYAMLLMPHGAERMPLVVVQHGGKGTPELCSDMHGENNYNHLTQRVLQRGAAVLAPQLLLWSKEEKPTARKHDVEYDRAAIDKNLKRFGMSITALEIMGIIKSIDYVCGIDAIDEDKVAMTGISYGGYFTLHTMAADTRIKAGYSCACFNDRGADKRFLDWGYKGSALKFQDAEVAALCAPRKLYVEVGKEDHIFCYESAVAESKRVYDYFKAYGCEENYKFKLWDGGHTASSEDEGLDFMFSAIK